MFINQIITISEFTDTSRPLGKKECPKVQDQNYMVDDQAFSIETDPIVLLSRDHCHGFELPTEA